MGLNNLITTQRIYTLSNFVQNRQLAETEDFHPNLSTDLSVFTLKIGHQNLLFSIDYIGLCRNSSLICYFPEIISILEKFGPNILKRLLIFYSFMTH